MKDYSIGSAFTVIIVCLFAVAVIGLRFWFSRWTQTDLRIHGQQLTVLVAKSPHQLYRGLGKRESLGEYDGMLFVFGSVDRHGIVMRDMLFPIDIVWMQYGEVVDIASRVAPEPGVEEKKLGAYFPRQVANTVLELPAGKAAELGLMIGDMVEVTR